MIEEWLRNNLTGQTAWLHHILAVCTWERHITLSGLVFPHLEKNNNVSATSEG